MSKLQDVSVVVPVGPKETAWRRLLSDLAMLPCESEIILVGTQNEPVELRTIKIPQMVRWVKTPKGRALQLNVGAKIAKRSFLWFLHADSQVDRSALRALEKALERAPNALHYFNLHFLNDGPSLMRLNTVGVWIRSHWMRLPFGDQGFCLSHFLMNQLGGFPEDAPFGEDHLLVWAAHHHGIYLKCTGASISTSARKYKQRGWGRATATTMMLTAKQAIPELVKLVKNRVSYESQ